MPSISCAGSSAAAVKISPSRPKLKRRDNRRRHHCQRQQQDKRGNGNHQFVSVQRWPPYLTDAGRAADMQLGGKPGGPGPQFTRTGDRLRALSNAIAHSLGVSARQRSEELSMRQRAVRRPHAPQCRLVHRFSRRVASTVTRSLRGAL
uniref:Uncharacterized protein n=1 Tax=uncultured bacterium B7P37metaSE TaxID=670783 RepID=C8CIK7_9BACT|nr:hypothetical protein [uncultured bacterium B7P37metaSE]